MFVQRSEYRIALQRPCNLECYTPMRAKETDRHLDKKKQRKVEQREREREIRWSTSVLSVCVCVCPPDSKIKYSVFYVYLCSCIILCYFTGIFYVVVRQMSMLFIDNKDSVLVCSAVKCVSVTWRHHESLSKGACCEVRYRNVQTSRVPV